MTTSVRRLAALFVASASLVIAGLAPAGAATGEKITIRIENDDKVTKKYAGMAVADASSEFVADPETCKAAPFCTLVPMDVLLAPDFNPDINEFVLTVKLSWDDRGLNAGGQDAQGNDLDMYIYFQEKDAKGATVYKEAGRAASAAEPEVAKLFTPAKKNYFIVVYNFLGVNQGFELAVSYRDATIEELGDFDGAPLNRPSSGGGGSTSPDFGDGGSSFGDDGGDRRPTFAGAARPTPRSPSLLPSAGDGFSVGSDTPLAVPTAPDDGSVFDLPIGAASAKDLASDLAEGQTQDVFKTRVANANPGPASAVLMGFWLGVVPLVLAGAVAVFMIRRRPAALTLQVTQPTTA